MQYNNNKRVRLDSVISGSVMLTVVQCITYRNLDYQTFNNVQNNLERCIKSYTFGEKLKSMIKICMKPDKI